MNNKNKFSFKFAIIIAITAIVIFCFISVLFNITPLDTLPVNYIGAALGSLIGALITFVLLRGQTDIEEKKGKDIRILEIKTEVFQKYIKEVWRIWEEQKITIEKFKQLTSDYYQNLMIYLNADKLEKIGKYLSEMGERIGKNEWEDIKELRKSIVGTINILSNEIDLGGQVNEAIMDEHDRIIFPLVFKNAILEAVNEALPTETILEKGKFEILKEGRFQSYGECLCYDFIKYKGCRIVIYDFYTALELLFVVDPIYKNFDDFRASLAAIGTYNQRIRIQGKCCNLLQPLPQDDTDKEAAPLIILSHNNKNDSIKNYQDSMEIYRTTKRGFTNVLAARIKYYFYEAKIDGTDLNIEQFLDKYYKN